MENYEMHVIGQLALAAFRLHGFEVKIPAPGELWGVNKRETNVTTFAPTLIEALRQHDLSF